MFGQTRAPTGQRHPRSSATYYGFLASFGAFYMHHLKAYLLAGGAVRYSLS